MAKNKKKRKSRYGADKVFRKPCLITQAGIDEIDYKDLELLKGFITEKGKIIPRRISGLSARAQKKLTRAIKQARNIALLSFAKGYVPQEEPAEQART